MAMQAQESDEGETGFDLSSDYLFYMDEPVFLDKVEDSAVTSGYHFALPEPAEATGNAASWEAMSSMEDLFADQETAQWLELDPSDDESEQKPEDIESYLISVLSPDEQPVEVQQQQSASVEPEIDIVGDIDGKDEEVSGIAEDSLQPGAQQVELEHQFVNELRREANKENSSPEASVLHQLQNIVTELDNRTRFCIRNALYRLAENAARRHTVHDGSAEVAATRCRLSTNTFETSTNLLDRTIANLLFHKQQASAINEQRQAPPNPVPTCCVPQQQQQNSHSICQANKNRNRLPGPSALHKHPCAGKLSSGNNPSSSSKKFAAAAAGKPSFLPPPATRTPTAGATHFVVMHKSSLPMQTTKRRMSVAPAKLPSKRTRPNQKSAASSSSLAV